MGDGVCTNKYQHVVAIIREAESLGINKHAVSVGTGITLETAKARACKNKKVELIVLK